MPLDEPPCVRSVRNHEVVPFHRVFQVAGSERGKTVRQILERDFPSVRHHIVRVKFRTAVRKSAHRPPDARLPQFVQIADFVPTDGRKEVNQVDFCEQVLVRLERAVDMAVPEIVG